MPLSSLQGFRRPRPLLRDKRKQLGLSVDEVEARTGVGKSFLYYLERCKRTASPGDQAALAAVYGTSVDELFEPAGLLMNEAVEEAKRQGVDVSHTTIRAAVRSGELAAEDVSRRQDGKKSWRIPTGDFDHWLSGHEARVAERRRAAQARRFARRRRNLMRKAGACGSPTCTDEACTVRPARCHAPTCEEAAAVAPRTNRKHRHVIGEPTLYCSSHRAYRANERARRFVEHLREEETTIVGENALAAAVDALVDLPGQLVSVRRHIERLEVGELAGDGYGIRVRISTPDDAALVSKRIETEGQPWRRDPQRYAEWRRQRFEVQPGSVASRCAICTRAVRRRSWFVRRAAEERRRFVCADCIGEWRRALMRSRRATDSAFPDRIASTPETEVAVDGLLLIAKDFERSVLERWPSGPGRRPPIQVNLAVEALFERGFTDLAIHSLLEAARTRGSLVISGVDGTLNPRYVERRRQEAQIYRHEITGAGPLLATFSV
jgi:transcriptional regulator with XRE-family HTH domain